MLRYIAVYDSGRVINRETARGQIVGGVVQGLGYALMEDIPLDLESGAPLALNLQDFKFPTLADLHDAHQQFRSPILSDLDDSR